MSQRPPEDSSRPDSEPKATPPENIPLGSWGRLYAVVLLELVVLILLFSWFTEIFR